jgi:hypothetical protein
VVPSARETAVEGKIPRLARLALLAAIALLAGPGCSPEPESPEARMRALLEQMEVAAEQKNLRLLKAMVSEQYSDEHHNDRQAILGLLTYHFLRHQSIHLLARVTSIEFPEPGQASVSVYVAMAGRPIPDVDALTRLRADLYRFDFRLGEGGESGWLVTGAAWRPAETADFL